MVSFNSTPSLAAAPHWGFPIQIGQSESCWQRQVRGDQLLKHGAEDDLPDSVDTVIIGSGITGCLIAKCIGDVWPSKSVVVLEARDFCSGATGRNAGHCTSGSLRVFNKYEQEFGSDQAIKIIRNEEEAQKALISYVQNHNVDCDLWAGQSLDVPVTPEVAIDARKTFLKYRDADGVIDDIDIDLDPASAASHAGIKTARARYARPAATLQPWKLAAHIMRDSLAKGVLLHTSTVVRKVERSGDASSAWTVKTDRGDVLCSNVVHATNAYIGAYESLFRGAVNPCPHIVTQVRPRGLFPGEGSGSGSYTVMLPHGATVSINVRTDLDGTVLLGGDNPPERIFDAWVAGHPELGYDDSFADVKQVTNGIIDLASADFDEQSHMPSANGRLVYESSWSGILGMSPDRMPLVGEIPGKQGQWACVGLNGYGMAKVFTAAPGLVKLMNGATWEQTGLPEAYQSSLERLERLQKRFIDRL